MLTFSDLRTALGLAPKTLPQASETLTAARAQLDSVNALFTAAGLPLEQMLATGPDALKAHLASLDKSADVQRLTAELTTAQADLTAKLAELQTQNSKLQTATSLMERVGVKMESTPEQATAAFNAAFEKETTLRLAKSGHPPAHIPSVDTGAPAAKTGAELHAQWKAMKPSAERLAFFSAHEAALTAFERSGAKA